MSLSTWTDRALFGPVERARVAVLERVVYAVLAFDLWVEMVPHGSRYGAGGLNVAHFAWQTPPCTKRRLHHGLRPSAVGVRSRHVMGVRALAGSKKRNMKR